MKKIVIILFLSFFAFPNWVLSQADNCNTPATVLTTYPSTCTTTTGNTFSATASAGAPTCVGTPDNDVWYQFTTGTGSTYALVDIAPASSGYDPVFQVLGGACGSFTSSACVNSGGGGVAETKIITGLTGSTTYYIRTYGFASGTAGDGSFTVCVFNDAVPANDECVGAIALIPSSSCTPTAGKSAWATSSGIAACTGNPDDDVWYKFTANATYERIVVSGDANYDPVVEVFSGGCGGLVSLKCQNAVGVGGTEDFFVSGLISGVTYYVRVYDFGLFYGTATTSGTFNICVMGGSPPTNDACAGALTLPVNAACVSFGGSSTSTFATPSSSGSVCAGGSVDDDVWYTFTAIDFKHTITVTPNVAMDAQIQLFSGTCGGLLSKQCQDAGGINSTETMVANGLTIGNTYYVRISHNGTYYGSNGAFTICNIASPPVLGNDPCGAVVLDNPTAACVYGTFNLTTATYTTIPAGGNCAQATTGANSKDIWLKVKVPANGRIDINGNLVAGGINDPTMSVYTAGVADNCASLTYIGCNDDYAGGIRQPQISLSGRTVGEWIYIRLGILSSATFGTGKTRLCVSTPTNESCANPEFICDFNGFNGTTSNSYAALMTGWEVSLEGQSGGPFGNGSTSMENPSWLAFEAAATSASLTLTVSDCYYGDGIQFQVLAGGTCGGAVGSWSAKSAFPGGNVYAPGSYTILATGLTIGSTYYILIDGFIGDLCNYQINGSTGVATSTLTAPSGGVVEICSGNTTPISVNPVGTGASIAWSSTPAGYAGAGSSITPDPAVSPGVSSGVVTYTATITGNCNVTQTLSAAVTVNPTPPNPTIVATPAALCGTTTLSLSASAVNATTFDWYNVPTGGAILKTGSTYGIEVADNQITTKTWYVQATNTSGSINCGSSARGTVTVPVNVWGDKIKWAGTTNTAWNNTANWGGCIPSCTVGVIIPSSGSVPNSPVIGAYTATTKDLGLEANSVLTIGASSALNLCGNFEQAGTFVISGGSPAITFNGSSKQHYLKSSTGVGDLSSIVINNAAGVKVSDCIGCQDMVLSANSTLTLTTGIFSTINNRTITLKNPAIATITGYGTASYINGRLKRYVNATGSYDFPVGNATTYQLMNLNLISKIGLNDITVSFANSVNATGSGLPLGEVNASYISVLDNGASGGNGGLWTIFPNAGTASYGMTLYGRGYGATGTISHTIAKRSTWCPGVWTLPGTWGGSSIAGGVITATRTGISGFSQVALLRNNIPLPIELLNYNLICDNHKVQLTWSTASEINNDYFTIEKSSNGIDFEKVTEIGGAGNSNKTNYYVFVDKNYEGGDVYYRLSQTDFDGTHKNVGLKFISCESSNDFDFINIIPNPTTDNASLIFNASNKDLVTIQLFDARSRLIFNKKIKAHDGINTYTIDMNRYETATYFIKIYNNYKIFTKKIIKTY